MENRVVITGIGVVTPIGTGKEKFWNSLENGISGVDKITKFDVSDFDCKIAAEVKDFDPLEHGMNKKELKRLDSFSQYALAAAHQAINDANLSLKDANSDIGVIVGSAIGGLSTLETEKEKYLDRLNEGKCAASFVSPMLIPTMMSNLAAGNISIKYKLNNSSMGVVSACASGIHSIICALKDIVLGDAAIMVSGASEGVFTPLSVGSFMNMNALCKKSNGNPKKASRPFDLKRNGFVIGEGAGIVILESLEHAMRRDAHIYAEIVGYGLTSDAYHLTAPDPDSMGITQAMRRALIMAELSPVDVDYINAHGTSTHDNDLSETKAIKNALGHHAYDVKISSTKSMTGHLLGAAGAVETVVCLLAMERGAIPPTINYEYPDPECDLYYVPNQAQPCHVKVAMNNSFGFGGHNAVLILKKYEG